MIRFSETSKFSRDLAGLLRLGYTLEEAVERATEFQSRELTEVGREAISGLRRGQTLTQALEPNSSKFPLFFRLVSSAEAGEVLEAGLARTADVLEELADRKRETRLIILYPSIVFTLVYSGSLFFLAFGGNMLNELFYSMNVNLPLATKLLLVISEFVSSPEGVALVSLPLILLWTIVLGKTPVADILYKVPLYGRWLKNQESIMYLSTAGQLLEQGTPLVDACRISVTVCSPVIARRLSAVVEKLESGDRLSEALQRLNVVPELAVWTIAQREESENLRLREVARLLQRELDCAIHTGNAIFEPLLFLLVFFGIGFFVTAVFTPLYQLIGNLG